MGSTSFQIDPQGRQLSEEQWSKLQHQLQKSIAYICPSWLTSHRDDLVQIALIKTLQVLDKSTRARDLGPAYLSRVAYSAVIDEIRRRRRKPEEPLPGYGIEHSEITTEQPDPERLSVNRQIGRSIREFLSRQAQPRRLALTLNLQGYTVPEAARQLGWTVKKAENHVYRGLADLRAYLAREGLQP